MPGFSSPDRLRRLRNRHAGERWVLVANGPSRAPRPVAAGERDAWTMTQATLQMADHRAFQLVLLGPDQPEQDDSPPAAGRVPQGRSASRALPDDVDSGQAWDNPGSRTAEASFRYARAAFEAAGRRIVDATLQGACGSCLEVAFAALHCLPTMTAINRPSAPDRPACSIVLPRAGA